MNFFGNIYYLIKTLFPLLYFRKQKTCCQIMRAGRLGRASLKLKTALARFGERAASPLGAGEPRSN